MKYEVLAFLVSLGLFVGMLIVLEIGRRLVARRLKEDGKGTGEGASAVDGAVFGLVGLLIAFSRISTRRPRRR